jgi:type III restriction enzyme
MSEIEVPEPILNSPFAAPTEYWYLKAGESPERRQGRRLGIVYPPRDDHRQSSMEWDLSDGTLAKSEDFAPGYELVLVNRIRERVAAWRTDGYPGVSRVTLELLQYWQREGRKQNLFFAQREAAETVIFLTEARSDFRQGIAIPRDEPGEEQQAAGQSGFLRYACKMATGSGKTTVMAMLAAWSILNKINDRSDARFSDVVLVVCPNVTIRDRLRELDAEAGDASVYRTRDLVPEHMMSRLAQGRVLVTNWHTFEPQGTQAGGETARVVKTGREEVREETIHIGTKTTTARNYRYMTRAVYDWQIAQGTLTQLKVLEEDENGNPVKVKARSVRYVESDTALVARVLGREVGGKQNILVMNDEAHHAYRIRRDEPDEDEEDSLFGEDEEAEEFFKEATVWVEGLDRVHALRGINMCVDLSATPYFLGRVGRDTNRPFPWVVCDFGLIDAIESGLVKIPQLAVRDTTGAEVPGYFNIWEWIKPKLTPAERGAKKASPKPEAILKYAHHPIAILGGMWDKEREERAKGADTRPPVFILVCKNVQIAKVVYEWLADNKAPTGIPPCKLNGFRNRDGKLNTIRVDSKVVHETDTGHAKANSSRWMRFTLDTVGRTNWPTDRQGQPIYPEGFEEIAKKLDKPLHPPGRDVRCIVSVGMLTEGWDCNTVTHIVGLRPFMSQLLCEQVVGRGLRRVSYELGPDGKFTEEVATVFGVPFEVIPCKTNSQGPALPPPPRFHIHALPARAVYEIHYPRVEGYTQAVRNRVTVNWDTVPRLVLDPNNIPPEVEVKGLSITNAGRLTLSGPGRVNDATLREFREKHRVQELVFDLAKSLTANYVATGRCDVPVHVLFPQLANIVRRYVAEKVRPLPPTEIKDLFLAPYFGWLIEVLASAIRPDTDEGETPEVPRYEANRGPGTTADVDFWTSREVREVQHCHLNYVVADTALWEQSAAYRIDRHTGVAAFVKNAGLGFSIPYFHNGQNHEYVPDFIVRLKADRPAHLILEVKGFDPLEEFKVAAATRWVAAVNVDGRYGRWEYAIAKKPAEVDGLIAAAVERAGTILPPFNPPFRPSTTAAGTLPPKSGSGPAEGSARR